MHAAINIENNMVPWVEVTSCSKDNRKKCFRGRAFLLFISASKSQMPIMELDFEADKPRMNAELRVIIG